MSKDPAFLFYPNDYIGGTMGMTLEEKGAYIELLMLQFNRGHMTIDMIGRTIGQAWDKIKLKFIQDDNGLWFNERLELEVNKRKSFTESRRNNKKGINQYTKKRGHMTCHMGNENENRNLNENENEDLEIVSIITYLNEKTKKSYKFNNPKTIALIKARFKEGFTLEDFKKAIDNKCATWLNDPEWSKYLRPQTLFSPKFEGYVNEIVNPLKGKVSNLTLKNMEVGKRFIQEMESKEKQNVKL